jgi:hypothetical protein
MDWLARDSANRVLYFARSTAMGIVDARAMGGRRGEKREARSEKAREGRREREGGPGGEKALVRLPNCALCRLCHCADRAVYLTLSEDGLPCPALPKMPSGYISETLCW